MAQTAKVGKIDSSAISTRHTRLSPRPPSGLLTHAKSRLPQNVEQA
jgi:hypothetical protein